MILETMEDGKDVVLYLRDLTGSGDLIYSTKVLPMPSPCSFFYLHFLFQGRTPPSIQWSYPEAESPHNASPSIASTFTLPPHPAPSIPSLHLHDHPHPPASHHSLPSQMPPQAHRPLGSPCPQATSLQSTSPPGLLTHNSHISLVLIAPAEPRACHDVVSLPLEPGLLALFTPPCSPHAHLHSESC